MTGQEDVRLCCLWEHQTLRYTHRALYVYTVRLLLYVYTVRLLLYVYTVRLLLYVYTVRLLLYVYTYIVYMTLLASFFNPSASLSNMYCHNKLRFLTCIYTKLEHWNEG